MNPFAGPRAVGFRVAALLIMALAVAVRLPALGERSFWIDELITRDVARLPFWKPGAMDAPKHLNHSIVSFTLHDKGPGPLTYVLDGMLTRWAEPWGRERWLRLPGIVAGLATVLIALTRGRRWTGGASGALALGTAAAVWPLWADFSTGARGYAWSVLVGLLQIGLLIELSARLPDPPPEGNVMPEAPARSAMPFRAGARVRVRWAVFVLLLLAGPFIHPFHLILGAGVTVGALAARFSRSTVRGLSRMGFYLPLAAVWALQLAWMRAWLARIGDGGKTPSAPLPMPLTDTDRLARLVRQAAAMVTGGWEIGGLFAGPVLLLILCLLLRRGAVRWRPAFLAATVLVLGHCVLLVLLAGRFFVAERYLFALSVTGAWLLALGFQSAASTLARRRALRRIIVPAAGLLCLAAAAPAVSPARAAAATPVHDWAAAVAWLKTRVHPDDLVILGPNADYEVYRAYADAAGIPALAPGTVYDEHGRTYKPTTTAGLNFMLSANRRIWFLTPFWRSVYPRDYWVLLETRFRKQAVIPGRAPIRIVLHTPDGDGSKDHE